MSNNKIEIRGKVCCLTDISIPEKSSVVLTPLDDKTAVEEIYPNKQGVFYLELSNDLSYSIQAYFKNFKSAIFLIPKRQKSVYLELQIYI
tara:strand:- start:31 stop:300 length:270 start_codon:yes stop_codon:yes gene_type:complete